MRITEPKVRAGFFWLPGKDEYKAPGTLTITDGGKVALEIIGTFSGPTGSFADIQDGGMTLGRVVGQVEREGLVTLDGCYYLKRSYGFGGITKSQIKVTWAILGVGFDRDEEVLFDEYCASIEGLDEWLRVSGISLELSDPPITYSIRYERPSPLTLYDSDQFSLSIGFGHTIPSMSDIKQAAITQSTYLKISTREPKEPVFFRKIIAQIREFLSLAVDDTVSVSEVWASNNSITLEGGEGKATPAKMDLYHGSINHKTEPPRIDNYRMLFRYPDISDSSQTIFARWFELYGVISPSINLYFSARAGAHKFLEGRFLSLAQAVETLHRRTSCETAMDLREFEELRVLLIAASPDKHKKWIEQKLAFANEVSLASRLKKLLEPFEERFGDKDHRKRVVRLIVDTRNYLTHYDVRSAEKAASGRNLVVLCEKLEAMLQLHFLRTLTFSDDQITAVCEGPQALKGKLASRFETDS
ncbi:HEPN domain-containing protein [Rhizobium johnstonii]|uniref:ApeA N-terminal domain 1-containing protein n=1 Tax=Rhizobium johnstonii TaxID=3019933 RepID=UPI003F9B4DE1